ncbi:AarF/UbiB family protein [Endozoicomonas ascidiicola]|uniref:AarF/UbiB family protein n=1 Tax=Endozoicomonas ascidiicola TaxID=1698521 RepID=UPI00082AEA3D|nr:AarF/UbiB family protein [Endozoicomonas ascidiicola]
MPASLAIQNASSIAILFPDNPVASHKKKPSELLIPKRVAAESSVHDKPLHQRKIEQVNVVQRFFNAIGNGLYTCYRSIQILGYSINIMVRNGSPKSVQQAADGLGGVFLKLLQFICSSEGMAKKFFGGNHEDYTKALRHVSSSNKPMSNRQLIRCLEAAGIDYEPELLDDRTNLGVGSIGEVNDIYTKSGQTQDPTLAKITPKSIVVKLISPANEAKILSDINLMTLLMKVVNFIAPGKLGSGMKASLTDFIESFKSELNLAEEAINTQTQARVFSKLPACEKFEINDQDLEPISRLYDPPDTELLDNLGVKLKFKVPEIDSRYTTRRSMVMQRVEGVTLTASDKNDQQLRAILQRVLKIPETVITKERLEVLRNSIKFLAFSQWLYCYSRSGFFNADIHDGNIMVAEENGALCVYFIDLGNALQHTKEQTIASQKIGVALRELKEPGSLHESMPPISRQQALDAVIDSLKKLGKFKAGAVDWQAIKKNIDALVKAGDTEAPEKRSIEIFDMIYQYGVKTPKDIMALFRAMTLIKGNKPPDMEKMKCIANQLRQQMKS